MSRPNFPHTFLAGSDDGAARTPVFDPALLHFGSAFRPGDPAFDDPSSAARWQDARRRATDHVLRAIAESRWGENLVLRGSRLMRAWFGDVAREPGDLDWVVRPATILLSDPRSTELLAGLTEAVSTRPAPQGLTFLPDTVVEDDIWTYERAAGRRVVFPWRAPELPGGAVQVDVVFGEEFFELPEQMSLATADEGEVTLWTAGLGQSLAWKLLWLETDMHAQGKDLYDAALLAERVFLYRVPSLKVRFIPGVPDWPRLLRNRSANGSWTGRIFRPPTRG
jgi:hypothetical protein